MKSFATIALVATTLTTTTDAAQLRASNMGMSKKHLAVIKDLANHYDCEAAGDIAQTIDNIERSNIAAVASTTQTCTESHSTHEADMTAMESKFNVDYNRVDSVIAEETTDLMGPINTAYDEALKHYCEPSLLDACVGQAIGSGQLITIGDVGKDLVSWQKIQADAFAEHTTAQLAYDANYAGHVSLNEQMETAKTEKTTHADTPGTCPYVKVKSLAEADAAKDEVCGAVSGTVPVVFNTAIGICDQIRDTATASIATEEETIQELEVLTEDLAHCEGNAAAASLLEKAAAPGDGAVTALLEEKMMCAKEHKKISVFLEMNPQMNTFDTSFLETKTSTHASAPPAAVADVVASMQTQVDTETAAIATTHASCVVEATKNRDAICGESAGALGSAITAFNTAKTATDTAFTTCLQNAATAYSSWLMPQQTELDNEYKICCSPAFATSLFMVSGKASADWGSAKLYAAGQLSTATSNLATDSSALTSSQATKAANQKSALQIAHDEQKQQLEFEDSQTEGSCSSQLQHLSEESEIIEEIRNAPDMQNQIHQDGGTATGSSGD